jgi:hypothetical protein
MRQRHNVRLQRLLARLAEQLRYNYANTDTFLIELVQQ